jgi:hypothetical protein
MERMEDIPMKRIATRLLTLLLAFAMLLAALAVPAAALSARQEKKLQTGQRSLNNPNGTFALPKTQKVFRAFRVVNKDSYYAGKLFVKDSMKHVFGWRVKPVAADVLGYVPLAKKSDKLPPHVELTEKEIVKKLLSGGVNNFYFAFQETDKKDIYNLIAIYFSKKGDPSYTTTAITYNAKTGVLQGVGDKGIWNTGVNLDPYITLLPAKKSVK